ncbi:unnamed protein product [Polarella glacialis]|uniref:Uncharacterized protein n=1 Tax=Polarella glacialis TaxID=89957 RepID=A0A813G6F4_POLGL|nr:unnamed protein product [Polarella glacialis]
MARHGAKGRRKFSKVLFWCHGTVQGITANKSHHQELEEVAKWAGAKLIYRPRSSMFVDWLQSNLGCFDSCTLIIDPEEVPALIAYCTQHGLQRSPAYPEQVIIFSQSGGQGKARPWCGPASATPGCQVGLVSEVAELYQILSPTWACRAHDASETTCSTCSGDPGETAGTMSGHSYEHYKPHVKTMPTSPFLGASFVAEVQVRQQRTKQEDTLDRWKLLMMTSSQTQMERLLSEAAPAFYED